MIKINRETKWKVGDTFLSGDDVYMICYGSGYFLVDLETGASLQTCDTLEELVDQYIGYDDFKIDLECTIGAGGMNYEL